MKRKLRLPERCMLQVFEALDIKTTAKRLPDDYGTAYRLKDGPCRGVVVNVYDTGIVLVQGRVEKNAASIRTLLEAVAAVVKTGF